MIKQLFLCIMAGALVITPGCTKRTKLLPEHMSSAQLEEEHTKYKTRGIALATAGSAVTAGAAITGGFFGMMTTGAEGMAFCAAVTALIGCGIYMIVRGADDLAKAKKLRRIQMKDAAQKRKLEREAQQAQIAY